MVVVVIKLRKRRGSPGGQISGAEFAVCGVGARDDLLASMLAKASPVPDLKSLFAMVRASTTVHLQTKNSLNCFPP
jgi:hypothetical protein